MQRFWAITTSILRKPVLVFLLLLSIVGCKTASPLVVEKTVHDTLYQYRQKYDSIYVQDYSTERYSPSVIHYDTLVQAYLKVDTLIKEKILTEYRYRLLRDTTYIHRTDTIPKIVTVEKKVTKKSHHYLLIILVLLFVLKYLVTP